MTYIQSYSSSADTNQQKSTFCFSIFSNFVFNGFPLFSAAIFDRRYKPRMLVCKPIQINKLKLRICRFEENNEDARVQHWKPIKTADMTSFNSLLFSRVLYCNCNQSHHNRVCGISDIKMSVILTENYVTNDLNTVMFVISGSKSIVGLIHALFFSF